MQIPLGQPYQEFDGVIVLHSRRDIEPQAIPPEYDELIGSVDDETFTVHPQPPMSLPVAIE